MLPYEIRFYTGAERFDYLFCGLLNIAAFYCFRSLRTRTDGL